MAAANPIQSLFLTCGAWYLPHTARAFLEQKALAGLWMTQRNFADLPADKFRRCWPFNLAMQPFYRLAPQIWIERSFYALFPVWRAWLRSQRWPQFNVAHAIMGYATEPFDQADKVGALKVVDCQNSHPTSYFGYWQRECDLWCPGERVPIPRWMFARMNRELGRADVILCPSTFVRETMVQNGIREGKCLINPFGVNTEVFEKRAEPPEKPRFICVGTICLRKGHQYLFRAFEQVRARLPEAELVCVGDYKCDFRRERPKWEGKFEHHERMSHPELAKLLRTGTAFVLASLEEGFARVLSEAMGAGLPIIGTHESGASTLVRDGVEGFIVPARQPDELAEAMIKVATDTELNRRMGDAAYLRGGASNNWQDYGDRLLAEYRARLKK